MAKADMNMTVELSPKDRQLLRDVVDAIRSLKPEEQVPESKTRLVEGRPGIPEGFSDRVAEHARKKAWQMATGGEDQKHIKYEYASDVPEGEIGNVVDSIIFHGINPIRNGFSEELLEGQYRDADGRLRREGSAW